MNWIRTSERLPGIDDYDVLLYCGDTQEMFVGEYIGQDLFQYATDRHGERIVCRPTHWQPLPEPPSEQCRCDMRTRLVGDGCQYCNPELAAELASERREG